MKRYLHVKLSLIYSMTLGKWMKRLHLSQTRLRISSVPKCTYLYRYFQERCLHRYFFFLIWVAWLLFDFMGVYQKLMCNDIVFYSRCYWCKRVLRSSTFPEFDMQVACLYTKSVLFIFVISHLSKCTFTRWKSYIVENQIYLKKESF